jgi:hypothetical protein
MRQEPTPNFNRVQFYLPKDHLKFLDDQHIKTLKPRAFFVREALRLYAKKLGITLSAEIER